jgi:hypothetical protein
MVVGRLGGAVMGDFLARGAFVHPGGDIRGLD